MAKRVHDFMFNNMMEMTDSQIDWIWHRDLESIAIRDEVWRQSILMTNRNIKEKL